MSEETRRTLSPDEVEAMHNLVETIQDTIPAGMDFDSVLHALIRLVAHGGVQCHAEDMMTKNHFVASVVEYLSLHYDELMSDYIQGERDDE